MNHMFSCLHMLTLRAWPNPARTHQSRLGIGLGNRRNSQWEGAPETTTRERQPGTRGRDRQKDGGGDGEKREKMGQDERGRSWNERVRVEGENMERERRRGRKQERRGQFDCACLSRYGSGVTQQRSINQLLLHIFCSSCLHQSSLTRSPPLAHEAEFVS